MSFALPIVLLATLVPRLLVFIAVVHHPQACLLPDSSTYLTLARNLWTYQVFGKGVPPEFLLETFRVPGYPLFLAPFTVYGSPHLGVAFIQCLIGALTVFVAWRWLQTLSDPRAAV